MASFHYEMQDLPSPEVLSNHLSLFSFGFTESGLWPREIPVGTEVFRQSSIKIRVKCYIIMNRSCHPLNLSAMAPIQALSLSLYAYPAVEATSKNPSIFSDSSVF